MDCYSLKNVSFTYPEQENKALDGLSFSVRAGEFVALCGPSGCGKTTLLRQLKPILSPHGAREGEIIFEGRPLASLTQREQSERIGFVLQDPDNQIVTDKVWHELAFGLESLGLDTPSIRRRVAEMAAFFGIEDWFYQDVSSLSGGQKQLLNLASVMVMQPSVLLLDEPTAQLDPIAASEFLATVGRIHRELGTTVLITEHRLEEVLPLADRMLVLDGGRLIADGAPKDVGEALRQSGHRMFRSMPTPMRVFAAVNSDLPCPVTVREGRDWLEAYASSHPLSPVLPEHIPAPKSAAPVITMDEVWFRYEQEAHDVLRGLSLSVYPGEILAVLGGNGVGKSTALSLMAGLQVPYRGRITVLGGDPKDARSRGLCLLPQNPQALFVKATVGEDLSALLRELSLDREEADRRLGQVIALCHLESLLTRHPFDLSGGERQRAALAKVLLLRPKVLLLDEPTKGLDAAFQDELAAILRRLAESGAAVVMVSHDVAFCAENAHRCALFFDGSVAAQGTPRAFFGGNSFYTTAANRMARQRLPEAVTAEDVIAACGGVLPPRPPTPDASLYPPVSAESFLRDTRPRATVRRLPLWRRIAAGLAGLGALFTMASAVRDLPLPLGLGQNELGRDLLMIAFLLAAALALFQRGGRPAPLSASGQRLSARTKLAAALILLAIPLTIFVGWYYLGDRKYYFISLLVILESLLPFFFIFEKRRPQARELILLATLCALGVAGRMAFFMLPSFKPVLALVILSGVALGAESGFLVGSMTMLVSNMYFQQGPWTPWQMFAAGLIGFLAGVLFRKGFLRRDRLALCVFGGLATVLIYGGIMNPCAMLTYQSNPTWAMLLAYYLRGVPVDLVHACATVLFLWFFSEPMLEKLDRIKTKYGLLS